MSENTSIGTVILIISFICFYELSLLSKFQHCLNSLYSNCLRFIRMSPERLEHLVRLVGPYITKKDCRSRETISVNERLILTLRYLASGDSQQSPQSFSFRVGCSTVSNIIRETCDEIWKALILCNPKPPSTTEDWLKIAQEFEEEWKLYASLF